MRARRWLRKRSPDRVSLRLQVQFPQYSIGRGSYGPLTVRDDGDGATLTIGSFSSIADGVTVFTGGEHRSDWVTTFPFSVLWEDARHIRGHPHSRGDVHIGSDVWIGADSLILSGVTIGDGAVIGARSVVRRDVPPYGVVTGNPASLMRYRFDPQQIEDLLNIKWWCWTDSEISRAIPYLLSSDLGAFIQRAKAGEFADS